MINGVEITEPIGIVLTHNGRLGDMIGQNILKNGGFNNSLLLSVHPETARREDSLEVTMNRINEKLVDMDAQKVVIMFVETNYGQVGESIVRGDLFATLLEKFPNCKTVIGYSGTQGSLDATSDYFKDQYPDIHYVGQLKGTSQREVLDVIKRVSEDIQTVRLNLRM